MFYLSQRNGHNRGFPKIDKIGIDSRFILKNEFSKKGTSNRDRTLHPRTVVLTCVQTHALPTEVSGQVLIEGSLTQLLFMHQLTFGLRRTERI